MIYEHNDIRSYLSSMYGTLCRKNSRYSLRAFARKLQIAPSMLSEVLNGKKKISREMAARIAESLQLSSPEVEYLCLMADKQFAKTEKRRAEIYKKLQGLNKDYDFIDLDLESFQVIGEWYHFALLEMLGLPDLPASHDVMAHKLGITGIEVKEALRRMHKLGLIEKTGDRFQKVTDKRVMASSSVKNEALRKFHNSMLEKAQESLLQQAPDERFVGSETLVFDESLLSEANEAFEECFRKIIALSERSQNPKHVFHIGIQFFALTKGDNNERN